MQQPRLFPIKHEKNKTDSQNSYNDNEDARKYDERLRAPVRDIELAVDPETGMKSTLTRGSNLESHTD